MMMTTRVQKDINYKIVKSNDMLSSVMLLKIQILHLQNSLANFSINFIRRSLYRKHFLHVSLT